ncbi:MAG: protein-disulfide reductase DsbD family protein [Prosthecobacter sp.]|nr:protein-disulfide reductase DsbD family protein [Prosthecobacter sp.]
MTGTRWLKTGLMIVALAAALPVSAQIGIKLQLVPEVTAIKPGQAFYVGLLIQHEPGYHTYWRFPGIVGVPTTVAWQLPPGFQAGTLEYPEPEATKMFQIKAQGYERDVLLQCRITPPADLKTGQPVKLAGQASWMACARSCHPGTLGLSLELPVTEETAYDSRWRPLFEKERAAYCHPSEAWAASAVENAMTVTVKLKPRSAHAHAFADQGTAQKVIFFTEDGWINSDEPQQASLAPDGTLTLVLRRSDVFLGKAPPTKLHGIVQRPDGWLAGGKLRSMSLSPDLIR